MRKFILSFFIGVSGVFLPAIAFAEPGIGSRAHFWFTFFFYLFLFLCLLPLAFVVYLVHGFIEGRFFSSDSDGQEAATEVSSDNYESNRN